MRCKIERDCVVAEPEGAMLEVPKPVIGHSSESVPSSFQTYTLTCQLLKSCPPVSFSVLQADVFQYVRTSILYISCLPNPGLDLTI
jgi:hypothetical protein